MTVDQLRKVEEKYKKFLFSFPKVTETKVAKKDNRFCVIVLHEGLLTSEKRQIATELGDIPLSFETK